VFMSANIMDVAKAKMDKAVDSLMNELKKIRTGRANVSMLDSVKVNYYGNPTPLNQVANVSCPDAKSFMIVPWESPMLKEIEQAIIKSDLGMNPMNDGKVVRLKVPELTEQRRKDLVKNIKKVIEDARVAVRMARRDSNDDVKKAQKDKIMSEDESKALLEKVQKMTDDFIKKIDKISDDKEKELMTV
jgi:ribosome recycling factor